MTMQEIIENIKIEKQIRFTRRKQISQNLLTKSESLCYILTNEIKSVENYPIGDCDAEIGNKTVILFLYTSAKGEGFALALFRYQ